LDTVHEINELWELLRCGCF